jgi:formate dehydrogenase alpha subunit
MVTLTIDGKQASVDEGTLVIEAARELGIEIPHMCYHKHLLPYGGCRVCLVEIERMPKLQTSCTTRVADGMVVRTSTSAVIKARQGQIEFLLANHPLECPVCDKGGECELQSLSYNWGRAESRFHEPKRHDEDYDFGPLVWRNMDRCVRCKRCVRLMDEVAGEKAINYGNRGPSTVVDTFDGGRFESKYSGNTVTVCPVGALLNEPFVYKARVWEAAYFNTVCPHCANGCNMQMAVRGNRVLRQVIRENPDANGAWLCDRGQFGFQFVNSPNRLDAPLIRRGEELVPASWNEALGEIAGRLDEIKVAHGPDAIGGIGSAKCTNEDNYVFQKFMRAVIGTPNLDHRVGLKYTAKTGGLNEVFDYAAGTCSLNSIRNARAIFVVGCDLSEEQPVTALLVREAVRWKGAHLAIASAKDVQDNRFAHDRLSYLPGTEVALINGMINVILSEGLEDKEYLSARLESPSGDGSYISPSPLEGEGQGEGEKLTGVPAKVIEEAARAFAQADGAVILYGRDVMEHPYAEDVIRTLANLALITGNVGKSNGGIMPILTDNNSQGAADMGVLPDLLPGHLPVSDPVNRDAFSEAWNTRLPEHPGLGTSEMLSAAVKRDFRALYVMGADPIAEFPDADLARKALDALDFLVVQDIFLTETAKLADVVLPAKCYAEKDGTFTSVERRVQRIFQAIPTVGPVQADWHAISKLADLMGYEFPYLTPDDIMEEIVRLVHTYGGMTYEWIAEGGVQWPCPTTDDPGSPVLYGGEYEYGKWKLEPVEYKPLSAGTPDYPMLLLTREVLFNGDAMVRESPAIAELIPEPWVEINPGDARGLDISDGDMVRVVSPKGSINAPARVTSACRSGVVVVPRGIPSAPANVLMDKDKDADYVRVEKGNG